METQFLLMMWILSLEIEHLLRVNSRKFESANGG
jgi:hypothetical protein